MRRAQTISLMLGAAAFALNSCGGGGGSTSAPAPSPSPSPAAAQVYAVPAAEALSVVDVSSVISHAVGEAQARGAPAVIAVTDRVGNVLGVFRMNGAPVNVTTSPAPNGQNIDAQNLSVPAEASAISKAITGAYLSSGGNAFSTRTASQIVQQHFPPAPSTVGLESGPLFGVQFSQLPCSDLNARFTGTTAADALIGPKRAPLGLAADPGGFPLYKNGVIVGGIGVAADPTYGFDPNILDTDVDTDELIALAGTVGLEAPDAVRAEKISVDGTLLRYSDAAYTDLKGTTSAFAAINGVLGNLVAVRGYAGAVITNGMPYGNEASGIRASTAAEFVNRDAFVLSDGSGANRFPIRAGTDGLSNSTPITAAEARTILEEAFAVMSHARAQIRQPLDSRAQVSITVVDTHGAVLGLVRSPDAPIFGTDVALQKARSVAFLSNSVAASDLLANPSADVRSFVPATRTFLADPNALTGSVAFGNRSIGNIARPYFPDGLVGSAPGPLSRPIAQFNPFSTGLQSALILGNLGAHLNYVTGASGTDTPQRCTALPAATGTQNRLQNGLQIFPGGVPIYRGTKLVGAIGVSGDGIDQDDMISFLGLSNAATKLTGIGNASFAIRADQIQIATGSTTTRLRYVSCPFAPFIDTTAQNVCSGL